jgi:hypothetical protein
MMRFKNMSAISWREWGWPRESSLKTAGDPATIRTKYKSHALLLTFRLACASIFIHLIHSNLGVMLTFAWDIMSEMCTAYSFQSLKERDVLEDPGSDGKLH